jgi:hypothetical protein
VYSSGVTLVTKSTNMISFTCVVLCGASVWLFHITHRFCGASSSGAWYFITH